MGLIGWIILGLIAGAIAKAILKRDNGGWFVTLLLGVVGALVGGWLGSVIFDAPLEDFWSIQTWLLAIVGSVIVLAIYGAITGRKGVRG
ncbi:GlsB/YeaQ/YmgE family stress response membrane protein [Cellulomonas denverensis]|uniref:GlsB/YeaQ/YmgE family stress response membrane protein n=1 Tax=Cellulomonas denverensis TaxID=264297 RepID=A0A7X6KSN6_9CELL|nr:GlsB/YeaQ/YmgE family stress response membrane protein [Cellulomonas denverensis]NKY21542.1 GlsB/YeaQ/YmgE family stress response membrane protein [Cellulomonas denverensis]GIG25433.1 membrane protein [Cellulomonas denverensis]